MARVTRDTARRSIEDLLARLPAHAPVDLTRSGPPPEGVRLSVRIEVRIEWPDSPRATPAGQIRTEPPPAPLHPAAETEDEDEEADDADVH